MKKPFRFFVASCVVIAGLCACSCRQHQLDEDAFADSTRNSSANARTATNSINTAAIGENGAASAGTVAMTGNSVSVAGAAGAAGSGRSGSGGAAATSGTVAGSGNTGGMRAQNGAAASGGNTAGMGGEKTTAANSSAAGTGPRTAAGGGATVNTAGHVANTSTQIFKACPTDGSPCKIMPFGDSITDGYNQDTPGGYRIELFRRAHSAGKNITFVGSGSNGPEKVDGVPFPHNHEGHSGWTIAPAGGRSGISTLVSMVMPQFKPHIVLLMIGTNDAIDNYEMAKAPDRLGQLIDAIYAQLPDVTILVAQLIPARGASNQGDDAQLNTRIMTFNQAIPAVVDTRASAGKHIVVVDMFTPYAREQRSMFEDQWHPNADGYTMIGSTWYTALQPLL